MKNFSFSILYLLFSVCVKSQSLSPEVIASSGNHFSSSGVSISWTIGEPVIETIGSSSAQLTQGFHQPFLTIEGINEISEMELNVFPNPTSGILNFTLSKDTRIKFISIYSMEGKFISSPAISSNQADISFLSAGVYLIKIETDKSFVTLRLLKN